LLLWFLIAVSNGPESYNTMLAILGGWLGKFVVAATLLCLSFHLLNGIRHLVWDTGRALDIKTAQTAGLLVLAGTVVLTAVLLGVVL